MTHFKTETNQCYAALVSNKNIFKTPWFCPLSCHPWKIKLFSCVLKYFRFDCFHFPFQHWNRNRSNSQTFHHERTCLFVCHFFFFTKEFIKFFPFSRWFECTFGFVGSTRAKRKRYLPSAQGRILTRTLPVSTATFAGCGNVDYVPEVDANSCPTSFSSHCNDRNVTSRKYYL